MIEYEFKYKVEMLLDRYQIKDIGYNVKITFKRDRLGNIIGISILIPRTEKELLDAEKKEEKKYGMKLPIENYKTVKIIPLKKNMITDTQNNQYSKQNYKDNCDNFYSNTPEKIASEINMYIKNMMISQKFRMM